MSSLFKHPYSFIGLIFIYMALGLIVLYSASEQNISIIYSQSAKLLMGLVLMFTLYQLPMRYIKDYVEIIYIFSVLMLIVVFLVGSTGKGATRWLNLGILKFQPSELIKITIPLILAKWLSDTNIPFRFMYAMMFTLIPMALIIKQPDLGTALMITFIAGAMIFAAEIAWGYIIALSITMVTALPFIWIYGLHDYQKSRILNFLNPSLDPRGSGYNIIQSKIAVGSGGFWGQGWLKGTQIHFKFLPEHATDFIFGVIAQEFGWIGCMTLLSLLCMLIYQIIDFCLTTKDLFAKLLCFGLAVHFLLSAIINIGMVIGVFPVVGIPLSLVSFAGTHCIVILISFGMILSCMQTERNKLIQ